MPVFPKTKYGTVIGREVPVWIKTDPTFVPGVPWEKAVKEAGSLHAATSGLRKGIVIALDPTRIRHGEPIGPGLFIMGVINDEKIYKVVTIHNGIDVTKHVKQKLGPAM